MSNVTKESNVDLPVILSFVAGTLMIISGLVLLTTVWYHWTFSENPMMGIMMGGGLRMVVPAFGPWIIVVSISHVVCGGIILYASSMLSKSNARFWGIVILVLSAYGLFSGGGFTIGSIVGIIAGVIVVAKKQN